MSAEREKKVEYVCKSSFPLVTEFSCAVGSGKNCDIWQTADFEVPNKGIIGLEKEIAVISSLLKRKKSFFISGELGTGKFYIANKICENLGLRTEVCYGKQLCSMLNQNLLNGHASGAFTDAQETEGILERVNGGVLIIYKAEDLNLSAQIKLLEIIERGEIKRLGSHETIKLSNSYIFISDMSPSELFIKKKLRRDFFALISENLITILPLLKRKEDIPLIADFILKKVTKKELFFSKNAVRKLVSHKWLTNVQGLKECIEKACFEVESNEASIIDEKNITFNTDFEDVLNLFPFHDRSFAS